MQGVGAQDLPALVKLSRELLRTRGVSEDDRAAGRFCKALTIHTWLFARSLKTAT
jgi:hypothetical protein